MRVDVVGRPALLIHRCCLRRGACVRVRVRACSCACSCACACACVPTASVPHPVCWPASRGTTASVTCPPPTHPYANRARQRLQPLLLPSLLPVSCHHFVPHLCATALHACRSSRARERRVKEERGAAAHVVGGACRDEPHADRRKGRREGDAPGAPRPHPPCSSGWQTLPPRRLALGRRL